MMTLYHPCRDMASSFPRPQRDEGARAVGLDPLAAKDQTPTACLRFQAWPATPPQTAHDSRRPSSALSVFSVGTNHSGPSSASTFSQPPTPVHGMSNARRVALQWPKSGELQGAMPINTADASSVPRISQPIFDPASSHGSLSCVDVMQQYSPFLQAHNMDSLGMPANPVESSVRNAWLQAQLTTTPFHCLQAGIPSELGDPSYHMTHGLGQDAAAASVYPDPSIVGSGALMASSFPADDAQAHTSRPVYPVPQVVVPSQMATGDDSIIDDYTAYHALHDAEDAFVHALDPCMSGYEGWESVAPAAPMDAYFGPCDGEDFGAVRGGILLSTPRQQHRSTSETSDLQPSWQPKRRAPRRSRKPMQERKAWFEQTIGETTLRCEGKPFQFSDVPLTATTSPTAVHDPRRQQPLSRYVVAASDGAKDRKPHKCAFLNADGSACSSSFDRSEHLKRHMSKHSGERPFRCPLCHKAIGRSDNCTDHFKTHLRAPKPGKRNKHCKWPVLEQLIIDSFPPKAAAKFTTNLRKWVFAGSAAAAAAAAAAEADMDPRCSVRINDLATPQHIGQDPAAALSPVMGSLQSNHTLTPVPLASQ